MMYWYSWERIDFGHSCDLKGEHLSPCRRHLPAPPPKPWKSALGTSLSFVEPVYHPKTKWTFYGQLKVIGYSWLSRYVTYACTKTFQSEQQLINDKFVFSVNLTFNASIVIRREGRVHMITFSNRKKQVD